MKTRKNAAKGEMLCQCDGQQIFDMLLLGSYAIGLTAVLVLVEVDVSRDVL